jgi:hypothetical protein
MPSRPCPAASLCLIAQKTLAAPLVGVRGRRGTGSYPPRQLGLDTALA